MIEKPESNFIKVKCGECNNEQTIFNRASGRVECLVCGEVLAEPKGGKVELKGELLEKIE